MRYHSERPFHLTNNQRIGGEELTELQYIDAVRRNSQRLFLIALTFTRRQQDAEDTMQTVFLKLWQHRGVFTDEAHMDRWLTRVCINESRSLLRRSWRKHVGLDEIAELTAAAPSEQDRTLLNAVLRLPTIYRTVIHLYYYEELSVKEIASLLHLSESAVKQRLSRGRKELRQTLEDENE